MMGLLSKGSRKLILNGDNGDCFSENKCSEKMCDTIMSNCDKKFNYRDKYFNYIENRISRFTKNTAIILLLSIGFSSVNSSREWSSNRDEVGWIENNVTVNVE
ncbi:hypothetical protein PV325_002760 [Microctonus aethiopoides]|nr:hypothetical protein PV325_002760 [Microctonus aethiopoides]